MRNITKGAEPKSLAQHRLTDHANYCNYASKDELRSALISEQRGLCCYCMKKIEPDNMKIEHWQCRTGNRHLELVYSNLLGACNGGESQPANLQHCDTKKGDRNLKWNPSNAGHNVEAHVRYLSDGSIESDDTTFHNQIERVLNLNLQALKAARKSALDGVIDWLKVYKLKHHCNASREILKRKQDKYVGGVGALLPFSQVAVWWIARKLER